jgi:hypothetical protein
MSTEKLHGKMSDHFKGLGTVTPEMVQARAREIALINGRDSHTFTEEDWEQARRELTGVETRPDEAERRDTESAVSLPDQTPGTTGRKTKTGSVPDEELVAEDLVQQGIKEAEHEQMVEGAKHERNQE